MNENQHGRIGDERAETSQDTPADNKRHEIGPDRLKQVIHLDVVPIERGGLGQAEDRKTGRHRGCENGHDGPGIVQEGPEKDRKVIQPKEPCAQKSTECMKAVMRSKRDEHADGECQGGAMRRLLKVQNFSQLRTECGPRHHGWHRSDQRDERKCS